MTQLPSDDQAFANEPLPRKTARHSGDLLSLAWPVMLSRAGILVMAFSDIAMLGRYSREAVAVSNLGIAIFVPVLVVSIGLASGMVPVISNAYGAGRWEECGRAWRRAMCWGGAVALIGVAIVWRGETFLGWFGQDPALARAGGDVAVALAPGLLGQTLFAVCAFYLESTRRPLYALVVMVIVNLLNVALNWVMIFGNLGFPEMGAVGAAWASTIARIISFGLLLAVILNQRDAHAAGVRGPWETAWGPGGWRAGALMRKLGFSAGLSNGFETAGFAAMTMFAGTLGTAALAAYSISHNLVSTVFMIGLGLAVATGVRVGQAMGAGNPREATFAGWTGVLVAFVLMSVLAAVLYVFRAETAAIYTDEADLAAHAAALMTISVLIFVPDSLQVILGQALRALGDAWFAVVSYTISFVFIMIPLGWWWISEAQGGDERSLALSIVISCAIATVLLAARFQFLTRARL